MHGRHNIALARLRPGLDPIIGVWSLIDSVLKDTDQRMTMAYTFGTTVDGSMEEVEERVTSALGAEGFGVLTRIDVAATLKAKIDVERDPYVILGACSPALANRALESDGEIGALLPCNVVLRAEGDAVAVRFLDPAVFSALSDAEPVQAVAAEARESLERVAAAIT